MNFYFCLIGPTLQLVFQVLQLLWRQSKEEAARARPSAHRGYVGGIILVHQAVCIFHIGCHGAARGGETSKGRTEVVNAISRVYGYGYADAFVSWRFASRKRGGMGPTDRACEAQGNATSRPFVCLCALTSEHDSAQSRNRGSDSPGSEQYIWPLALEHFV